MAESRMSFSVAMKPEMGAALIELHDMVEEIARTRHEMGRVRRVVAACGMEMRVKQITKIGEELEERIANGRLVSYMMRGMYERHPVLEGEVEAELLRQFGNVLFALHFAHVGEDRQEQLESQVRGYMDAALAAAGSEEC